MTAKTIYCTSVVVEEIIYCRDIYLERREKMLELAVPFGSLTWDLLGK